MVSTRKTNAATIPVALGFGLLLSIGVTLALAACSAYLIFAETITEGSMNFCSMITLGVSAAAGAWLAAAKVKSKRMQICLLLGLCYYLLLLSMTALFLGGEYASLASSALAVFLGCGSVAIIGAINKKDNKKKAKKMAYR